MERREFYRVSAFGRVVLRALSKEQEEEQRRRLRVQHVEPASVGADESEAPYVVELLRRIALSVERIERRLAEPSGLAREGDFYASDRPVEISLSASGFAGHFDFDGAPEQLVLAELDLWEAGLPVITALARRVPAAAEGQRAFQFEEIHTDDRERIVQLAVRTQSQALRRQRTGE